MRYYLSTVVILFLALNTYSQEINADVDFENLSIKEITIIGIDTTIIHETIDFLETKKLPYSYIIKTSEEMDKAALSSEMTLLIPCKEKIDGSFNYYLSIINGVDNMSLYSATTDGFFAQHPAIKPIASIRVNKESLKDEMFILQTYALLRIVSIAKTKSQEDINTKLLNGYESTKIDSFYFKKSGILEKLNSERSFDDFLLNGKICNQKEMNKFMSDRPTNIALGDCVIEYLSGNKSIAHKYFYLWNIGIIYHETTPMHYKGKELFNFDDLKKYDSVNKLKREALMREPNKKKDPRSK